MLDPQGSLGPSGPVSPLGPSGHLGPQSYWVQEMGACSMALVNSITDDPDMRDALDAAVATWF